MAGGVERLGPGAALRLEPRLAGVVPGRAREPVLEAGERLGGLGRVQEVGVCAFANARIWSGDDFLLWMSKASAPAA